MYVTERYFVVFVFFCILVGECHDTDIYFFLSIFFFICFYSYLLVPPTLCGHLDDGSCSCYAHPLYGLHLYVHVAELTDWNHLSVILAMLLRCLLRVFFS